MLKFVKRFALVAIISLKYFILNLNGSLSCHLLKKNCTQSWVLLRKSVGKKILIDFGPWKLYIKTRIKVTIAIVFLVRNKKGVQWHFKVLLKVMMTPLRFDMVELERFYISGIISLKIDINNKSQIKNYFSAKH